jgi:hypothetical protein
MNREMIYHGIQDILYGRIAHEAIIELAPYIRSIIPAIQVHDRSVPILGNNYVYIAGKVTGMDYNEAFTMFVQHEHLLMSQGYKTINPLRIIPANCNWEIAMCIGICAMVKHCDKIHMIENWTDSNGARIEKQLAEDLGYKFIQFSNLLKIAI